MNMSETEKLYHIAKRIIPGGTQLLSKRPEMFLPGKWPAYYSKAKGCEVWDLDGNKYYDTCIMGVGACVLGYAFDEVDEAAREAIARGSMCTLNAPEEVELAEKLLQLHPWADMVRYAKAGGEAMAMAARIARAATKKDIVLVCGYNGWHDWYLAANLTKGDPLADVHLKGLQPLGVPAGMAGTNLIFHYNDIKEFKHLVYENRGNIAAVIMEPIRNNYPKEDFLRQIRKITEEERIVLVFDEITAGFRLCLGGSHLELEVNPDIAVFAKAMTNGYPVAAVIGKEQFMQVAQDTFISSTFWTERIGFAAALKSLECYEKYQVDEHINKIGRQVQEHWAMIAAKHNIKIHISGICSLSHFEFEYNDSLVFKTYFTQEMLKKGFLASTGFYMSYAHTEQVLDKYFTAFDEVMGQIERILAKKENILQYVTEICHAGFERLN